MTTLLKISIKSYFLFFISLFVSSVALSQRISMDEDVYALQGRGDTTFFCNKRLSETYYGTPLPGGFIYHQDTTKNFSIDTLIGNFKLKCRYKKGALVGKYSTYYPNGSICEDAEYDTIPYKYTHNNSGGCVIDIDHTDYRTKYKYYKKYYSNGMLQGEAIKLINCIKCATFNDYFRNGKIYSHKELDSLGETTAITVYDTTGNLTFKREYNYTVKVSSSCKDTYYSKNKVNEISEILITSERKNKLTFNTFTLDGTLISSKTWLEDY